VDSKKRIAVVLLVEDNADDVFITARAFQRIEPWIDLRIARDGREALDYLMHRGLYEARPAPRPDIVLLDLNLPTLSGLDVLQSIRANPGLASIPVVMLTSSDRQESVEQCYAAGANTFIRKPLEFEQSLRTLEVLGQYWLALAQLPKAS
jgi:two-component system response regulator